MRFGRHVNVSNCTSGEKKIIYIYIISCIFYRQTINELNRKIIYRLIVNENLLLITAFVCFLKDV